MLQLFIQKRLCSEGIYWFILVKIIIGRDFYLLRFKSEGQQKPGDVSLMQSDYK
jgi:hypothetical protein